MQAVLCNLNDPILLNQDNVQKKGQPRSMDCSVKWGSDGEKTIDVKLPKCKVVAEPDILFRILHIFLEG